MADREQATVITVHFMIKKLTPGAVQYYEIDTGGLAVPKAEAKVGTLYIRKSAFAGEAPEHIVVTVTY